MPRPPESRRASLEQIGELCRDGPRALEARSDAEAERLVELLFTTWIEGRIPARLTGVVGDDTAAADRCVGWLWGSLPTRLTERCRLERSPRTDDELRRWCWIPSWHMGQDEDLLLMGDESAAPLLEEAAAGCPKRDYAIAIIAHHARDSAHHALWEGEPRLEERLRRIGGWIALARAVSDDLELYFRRLASYADRRSVDRDEARQRVLDLRRCDPRPAVEPDLRREGHWWSASLDRANGSTGRLFIDADRGRMHAVEDQGS